METSHLFNTSCLSQEKQHSSAKLVLSDKGRGKRRGCGLGMTGHRVAPGCAGVLVTSARKFVNTVGQCVNVASAVPVWQAAAPVLSNRRPAKEFPFVLDPFQSTAIDYIEQDQSVLVSAHTSAGKTVVAEYAIAKSFRESQRVVYTSPIKALSNQKFRDLQEEFGDVGLMTGDITINPVAKCLVMTTEILRSMLYRGSELMREVKWVIYDEIHYMRDRERGVIWEESIILLPHSIRYVFLSATIPNALQFAAWIATIHRQPCHVVSTDYRPTPLAHYIFCACGKGLHLVVDEKGNFREHSFSRALAAMHEHVSLTFPKGGSNTSGAWSKREPTEESDQRVQAKALLNESDMRSVLQHVTTKELHPCIVFAFSKVKCERSARCIVNADYTDAKEKELIRTIYQAAVQSLSEKDRALPQVRSLILLLERGVGVHHGGLLPLVKEIVEILFQESLIKVLFATETFAIGVNMPAKSVIFTECCKFDGAEIRWLTTGEYIQMSGRAGRRGKDEMGTVIQMVDRQMDPDAIRGMLHGKADSLNSSYQVTYNMLLNLLRVEGAEPEYLILSSFHQHQQETRIRSYLARAKELRLKSNAIVVSNDVVHMHSLACRLEATRCSIRSFSILKPECIAPWLQPGRLVLVRLRDQRVCELRDCHCKETDVGLGFYHLSWAVILAVSDTTNIPIWSFKVCTFASHVTGSSKPKPTVQIMDTLTVSLACIYELSALRISVNDVCRSGNLQPLQPSLVNICSRFDLTNSAHTWANYMSSATRHINQKNRSYSLRSRDSLPLLDVHHDFHVSPDTNFSKLEAAAYALDEQLHQACAGALAYRSEGELLKSMQRCALKESLERHAYMCWEVSAYSGLVVSKDILRRMMRVLKCLGHVSQASSAITLKGHAACEINSANELIAAEILFSGVFSNSEVQDIAALLAPLVFVDQQKDDQSGSRLRPRLANVYKVSTDAATTVAEAILDANIDLNKNEFLKALSPNMMEVVFQWAQGATFSEVLHVTTAYEGTVIRVIRRLDELLAQLACASCAIGNYELQALFESTRTCIKRDIVFVASLYI